MPATVMEEKQNRLNRINLALRSNEHPETGAKLYPRERRRWLLECMMLANEIKGAQK